MQELIMRGTQMRWGIVETTMRRIVALIFAGVMSLFLSAELARAEIVSEAEKLDQLEGKADIVLKGTVLSSTTGRDDALSEYSNSPVIVSRVAVVSMIKGAKPGDVVEYRHFDDGPDSPPGPLASWSQFTYAYHLVPGRSYILFGKRSGGATQYRQVEEWGGDRGAMLCASDKPVTAGNVTDACWDEVMGLLKSGNATDVRYAIKRLDRMGISRQYAFSDTADFDREKSLAAISGVLDHPDPDVVALAIETIGCNNPYLDPLGSAAWLATKGSGNFSESGWLKADAKNEGGEVYWEKLVAIADDTKRTARVRCEAIRALGLARKPGVRRGIDRWLADKEPKVRAAATLLLADYPGDDTDRLWATLAGDGNRDVRAAAAMGVGYAQRAELAGLLGKMISDKDMFVRRAAGMSLLSFPAKQSGIAGLWRANLGNAEFQPIFLNALARNDGADYADQLAEVITKARKADVNGQLIFWGGLNPSFDSWNILRSYLQTVPVETLKSGKMDRCLDALEHVENNDASRPGKVYAFYLTRGMNDRAAKFRGAIVKGVIYNLDEDLQYVAKNPVEFDRE